MSLIKPQQLDAERAVIRCLMSNPELIYDVNPTLNAEMFYGIDNAVVFNVIEKIFIAGNRPDTQLVKMRLHDENNYDLVGGDAYFNLIDSLDILQQNINEYSRAVWESYVLRELIQSGTVVRDTAYSADAGTALNTLFVETDKILEITSSGRKSPSMATLIDEEIAQIKERIKNPDLAGIPTGMTDFDFLMQGLHETDEIVLAARTSVGKTSFATRVMLNVAKQQIPCAMFSYEMSYNQMTQRLISMESGVELNKIRSGRIETNDELAKIAETAKQLRKLPITINNNSSLSVEGVVAETRKMIRSQGIKFLVVDYLQLMPHRVEFATLDIGHIVRALKNLAVTEKIVVMTLSQFNRNQDSRRDKAPLLSDLRQSGNIEEHSDIVLCLQRDAEINGVINMYILKNRNGPTGTLNFFFNAPTTNFKS